MGQYHISYVYLSQYWCMRHLFIYMREKSLKDEISALANAEEKGMQKKAIEIAKSLLDVLDAETIALKTGLTIKEIEKLK